MGGGGEELLGEGKGGKGQGRGGGGGGGGVWEFEGGVWSQSRK